RAACGGSGWWLAGRGWEVPLPLRLSEENGQHSHPPVPQFGERLVERPGLKPTVMQQRDQGTLIGARIRLPIHVMRIGRGVAHLIGRPTPHDTQHACFGHLLFLSACMLRLCASVPSSPRGCCCPSLPSPPCRSLPRLAMPAVVALSAAGQDLLRWRAPSRSCQWDFAKHMPLPSPPPTIIAAH